MAAALDALQAQTRELGTELGGPPGLTVRLTREAGRVLVAATRPAAVVEVSYGRANSAIRRTPRGLSPLVGSGHGLMLRKIRLVIAIA